MFMCEVHFSVMLAPSTHAAGPAPCFVPDRWEQEGGRVEAGQGLVQKGRACPREAKGSTGIFLGKILLSKSLLPTKTGAGAPKCFYFNDSSNSPGS